MIVCAHPHIWFDHRTVECNVIDSQLFDGCIAIYEVLRVQQGVSLFLEDHLYRLQNSIILASCKWNSQWLINLETAVAAVIKSNEIREGKIEISLTFDRQSKELQHLLVYSLPLSLPIPTQYSSGVDTMFYFAARGNPEIKEKDASLKEASDIIIQKRNLFEVILVDRFGRITEGSRSNVFFVTGQNEVSTAPSQLVLGGITRNKVIEIARSNGILVNEKPLMYNELSGVQALFLTGTSPKVLPVRQLEEYRFSTDNDLMRRLILLYDELITSYLNKCH